MKPTAKLETNVQITCTHTGAADSISKKLLMETLRSSVLSAFQRYTDDPNFPVAVDVFICEYQYEDNLEKVREELKARIDKMTEEELFTMLTEKK